MYNRDIMLELAREALIQAPPEVVYDLIADVDRYEDWNPWNFRGYGGPAVAGRNVEMSLKLGRHILNVRHEVLESRRAEKLTMRDVGWYRKVADGVRTRELRPVREGTLYRVALTITGPLAWVVRLYFRRDLEVGLSAETDAIKRTAEQRWRKNI